MILQDFRIIKLDEYNYTFERYIKYQYRSPSDGKTLLEREGWKRVGGYYGNVSKTLLALKYYITSEIVGEHDDYTEVLKMIDELDNKIVEVKLREDV